MKINITIDAEYKKLIGASWLRKVARLALKAEKADTHVEIALVITGDEKVHILNRDYLQEDRTTDVLSFPMLESIGEHIPFVNAPDGCLHLGDIIISYPQALKQAEEHAHPPEKEIAVLLIHGILHLLGYDHDIPEREQAMHGREAVILKLVEETLL